MLQKSERDVPKSFFQDYGQRLMATYLWAKPFRGGLLERAAGCQMGQLEMASV